MFLSKFRLTILLAAVLCVWLLPSNAQAQKVHALLVIMDDDAAMRVDRKNINNFLKEKVDPVYETDITVLNSSAGETTITNIQREIRALRPGRDDVVFVYFSGHGGMISQTDRRTYLIVSDPADPSSGTKLMRADLKAAVNAHTCRLKLIVTDACSNYPLMETGARTYTTFAVVRGTTQNAIRNLFGAHKGLLHINGATEGQYGWSASAKQGGIFTESLISSIAEDVDRDENDFIEWSEVVSMTRAETGRKWGQVPYIQMLKRDPEKAKEARLDPEQITMQSPRVYSEPSRTDGKTTEMTAGLWKMSNTYSKTKVSFEIDRDRYRVEDQVMLTVRPKRDSYLTVLNWGPSGSLTQLFPNEFDQNNYLRGGKTYTIPPSGANYGIFFGESGSERMKILTIVDKRTSEDISRILPASDNPKNPFRYVGVRAYYKELTERVSKEEQIEKILKGLPIDDWGEARIETTVVK